MQSDVESLVIFVVGNSRSGTTMMGRILGREKDVFTFGELHFFGELIDPDNALNPISTEEAIRLTASLFDIQRNGLLKKRNIDTFLLEASELVHQTNPQNGFNLYFNFLHYETRKNNKSIPCEQTPGNIYVAKEILNYYPNSFFIHMIRDPRDILLSQKMWKHRRKLGGNFVTLKVALRMRSNYHPITLSKLWCTVMKTRDKIKDTRIKDLRFEELLSNPVQEIKNVCNLLNLTYVDDLLNVPQVGSSLKMDSPDKKGIDNSRTNNWKKGGLNNTEIFLSEKICSLWMKKFNYISSNEIANPFLLFWYWFILPIKLTLSLLMNLTRNRNILKTIRRRFFN